MSVNAGGKPIVTDKLIHVYDPLSPVCYPSGSETFRNHFSEAHVKKLTNGYGTNTDDGTNLGFAKNGLVAYGEESAHQRQKGYFESDGSSDHWEWYTSNGSRLPVKGGLTGANYPASISFGGWFKFDPANTTTRYIFGFGTTNSSYAYSYVRQTSAGLLDWYHEPYSSSTTLGSSAVNVEDNTWHYLMCVIEGVSSSTHNLDFYFDGGLLDHQSSSGFSAGSSGYIGGYSNYARYYNIGTVRTTSSSANSSSHLGQIGPHHFYAKALTKEECQQNYYAQIDRFNF